MIRRCSEYFEAMFDSQMIESTQERIELKEVNPLAIRVIYFYRVSLNFSFRHFFIQKGSLFPGGRVAAGEIDKICILPPVIIRYEKY